MSAFPAVVNLGVLAGVQGSVVLGRVAQDRIGSSSAFLGDVNGDGLADWGVAGRHEWGTAPTISSAYLLLSGEGLEATRDLATQPAFRIGELPSIYQALAIAIAGAGDINGDGFADVVIGSPSASTPGRLGGGALVYLGGPAGPSLGFQIHGAFGGDQAGTSVTGLGDVNGDGLADFAVAAQGFFSTWPAGQAASTHVILGSAGPRTDLDLLSAGNAVWRIDSPADYLPRSIVAAAGDVNGDGFADIALGHLAADANARTDSGSVTVVFGRAGTGGVLAAGSAGAGSFRIDGATAGARTGSAIAGIGDINGDGLGDLLIGAPQDSTNGRSSNGAAYVVFGGQADGALLDLANLGSAGFRISGAGNSAGTGTSVAAAGDVNGDGRPDFLIGAYGYATTWLVLGRDGAWTDIDLAAPPAGVTRFQGVPGTLSGYAVAGGGDADGDGFADILIGAPLDAAPGRAEAGRAYLLLSNSTGGTLQRGTTLADTLRGGAEADTLLGNGHNDKLFGRAGDDSLSGGTGHDTLDGGSGNDTMDGGIENDTYVQHDIGDVIIDSAGDDTLWLLVNATIAAGIETTRLAGAADNVTGTAQADQIVANASRASRIDGADGHDHLWAGPLSHTLIGGAGDDTLRGQDGAVRLEGGTGDDHLVVGHLGAVLVELAGQGIDTAWVTVNGYTIAAGVEITRLAGSATSVTGSAEAEQIVANPVFGGNLNGGLGDDVLWGSAGADTLNGDWGNDTIRGQGGRDEMWGGQGHDHFVILQADVTAHEAEAQGWDTAWVAVDGWTAQAHIEQIMLSGGAGVVHANDQANLIGGNATRANAIIGAGGDDTIFGSGFADTLTGGAGNDVLYSLGGADRFVYAAPGWGYDQIGGFAPGAAKLDFRGSGITFGQLTLNSAGANTQVEFGGHAILLHGVAALGGGDFLF
jgi:Ca2+-binding RTX toxin-like protein